jgi:hypothetical protein
MEYDKITFMSNNECLGLSSVISAQEQYDQHAKRRNVIRISTIGF